MCSATSQIGQVTRRGYSGWMACLFSGGWAFWGHAPAAWTLNSGASGRPRAPDHSSCCFSPARLPHGPLLSLRSLTVRCVKLHAEMRGFPDSDGYAVLRDSCDPPPPTICPRALVFPSVLCCA